MRRERQEAHWRKNNKPTTTNKEGYMVLSTTAERQERERERERERAKESQGHG